MPGGADEAVSALRNAAAAIFRKFNTSMQCQLRQADRAKCTCPVSKRSRSCNLIDVQSQKVHLQSHVQSQSAFAVSKAHVQSLSPWRFSTFYLRFYCTI
eukprot:1118098-Pelagomonas_calceolata.AAC.4